jgi:Flp pilus assembly pilin Flp
MFHKLLKNKKGVLNVVTGAVIAVIIAAVLIMVAAQILANLSSSMPAVTGAARISLHD